MLEKMSAFFESRLNGYDEHMMTDIESANEFYPFTAKQLPTAENCHVLDLGCGTGLEGGLVWSWHPASSNTLYNIIMYRNNRFMSAKVRKS